MVDMYNDFGSFDFGITSASGLKILVKKHPKRVSVGYRNAAGKKEGPVIIVFESGRVIEAICKDNLPYGRARRLNADGTVYELCKSKNPKKDKANKFGYYYKRVY
jgi:hypothetical protein